MTVTQRQIAYEWIRQKLIRGILSAGDRLSPAALAREIGVSHIPVREAISQLHSEGLVELIPRRGAFVRQADREEVIELTELRSVLECNAAACAARRISEVELDELAAHLRGMRELVDQIGDPGREGPQAAMNRWGIADVAFHRMVLQAAGNRQVVKVIQDANIMVRMFGYPAAYPPDWPELGKFYAGNYKVHRSVFVALRRRDSKAARRAMAAHMRRARRNILERFDWLSQQQDTDKRGVPSPV